MNKILMIFCALLLVGCLPEKQAQAPVDAASKGASEAAERMLDIKEIQTESGITAWLVEDHTLPIISLQFSFRGAGALQNSAAQQGLAQLLSNTMDEGAGDYSSQDFQKALSDHSISLSFSASRDNFGGQVTTLSRHKGKAFKLLDVALHSPRFDSAPVERMKQANMARLKSSMGNPNWVAARYFNDIAFAGHPYALNSGGTLSSLAALTPEDLRRYHQDFLTRERVVVSAAGDITADELSAIIDKIFDKLPVHESKDQAPQGTLQNTGKSYLYEKDIPQTLLQMALPLFEQSDPDYYKLLVMDHVFGSSGFGSRLMEEAREKRGLTYGIYSGFTMMDNMNYYSISTSTKNEAVPEMIEVIKGEMERIKATPISDKELREAKDYIIGSLPLSLSSTGRITNILMNLQMDNRPITYLDAFPQKIEAITSEDVQSVARRIFETENILTLLVGMPEGQEDSLAPLIKLEGALPNVE